MLARIAERGWADDLDVVFTTDHGELQGDFGLLFKGPYHVDALMRLPLVWRPAPSAGRGPAVVPRPVGLVDLAPTFCAIAGIERPGVDGGRALPVDDADADARGFERVLTEWDSELFGTDVHLRTIMRDHWVCIAYLPGTSHDGTEGELYDLGRGPAPAGQPVGRSGPAGHPGRPGGRPVGPPAAGPPTPAGPGGAGLTAAGPDRSARRRGRADGEFRSKMIRRPWRVSQGSTYSISSE